MGLLIGCIADDFTGASDLAGMLVKSGLPGDASPAGNIGPVADALLDALDAQFTVVCPAFPANGRTIYQGYLFAGDVLLNESGMRDHPLTPMTDANLVRVMGRQTRREVGLVGYEDVKAGPEAIRARFDALRREGVAYAVVDVLTDDDLLALGAACKDLALVTAGSGLALGLAPNFKERRSLSAGHVA